MLTKWKSLDKYVFFSHIKKLLSISVKHQASRWYKQRIITERLSQNKNTATFTRSYSLVLTWEYQKDKNSRLNLKLLYPEINIQVGKFEADFGMMLCDAVLTNNFYEWKNERVGLFSFGNIRETVGNTFDDLLKMVKNLSSSWMIFCYLVLISDNFGRLWSSSEIENRHRTGSAIKF